jgi:hypothetical protein
MNNTHPIKTALTDYKTAKSALEAEAKKALPAFLEAEDLNDYGKVRSENYLIKAEGYWLDNVDEDNEFIIESDNDYQYVPFDFFLDPQAHLQEARQRAQIREAERNDRALRLRNERIGHALETLRLEGIDISKLEV